MFQKRQFSSKTTFVDHLFGERSHTSCSYRPYGRFLVFGKYIWCVKFNQNLNFWGKPPRKKCVPPRTHPASAEWTCLEWCAFGARQNASLHGRTQPPRNSRSMEHHEPAWHPREGTNTSAEPQARPQNSSSRRRLLYPGHRKPDQYVRVCVCVYVCERARVHARSWRGGWPISFPYADQYWNILLIRIIGYASFRMMPGCWRALSAD